MKKIPREEIIEIAQQVVETRGNVLDAALNWYKASDDKAKNLLLNSMHASIEAMIKAQSRFNEVEDQFNKGKT